MKEHFDYVVVGAGVVGSLMAILLAKSSPDTSIALIDPVLGSMNSTPTSRNIADLFKHNNPEFWHHKSKRVSAINHSLFLQLQKATDLDLAESAAQMLGMEVFTSKFGGRFEIDCADFGGNPLAWVISNQCLAQILIQTLQAKGRVRIIGEQLLSLRRITPESTYAVGTSGRELQGTTVIGADGARSKVRQLLGIIPQSVGAQGVAVSAQVKLGRQQSVGHALQWFLSDGSILGLLPVAGQSGTMSMVWSFPSAPVSVESGEELQKMMSQALMLVGHGDFADNLEVISEPQIWPLHRQILNNLSWSCDFPNLYFIGDAAHVIHPLAGQGLNLGLADCFALGAALKQLELGQGSTQVLTQRYLGRQVRYSSRMLWLCEGLRANFERKSWSSQALSALAFTLFDQHILLKKSIVRAMSFKS